MTEPSHRRGLVLAGGIGSRLQPMTRAVSKQLLPVYDKPLIYYPLSTLMLAGIRELLVVSAGEDQASYRRLLGDGGRWGLRIDYAIQEQPRGLAHAVLAARDFLAGRPSVLVLGDNLFYGQGLRSILARAARRAEGATIFAYPVRDAQDYGVVELDERGLVKSLEEKPARPRSNYAVPGLYFYDEQLLEIAEQVRPSARGEWEITDVHCEYLRRGRLHVETFTRGFAWLDAGTPDSLLQAASFVQTVEQRQGFKIACLEEIAWLMNWISLPQLEALSREDADTDYSKYLQRLVREIHEGRRPPGGSAPP